MNGRCARCGQAMVELSEYALALARTFNHHLVQRGTKPLSRHEVGLCEACTPLWQAERSSEAAKSSARLSQFWGLWRQDAASRGVDEANRLADPELFRAHQYRELRELWVRVHVERRKGVEVL